MKDIDLTIMSDLQLAEYKQGCREDNPRAVLVEKEFERRARLEQHKLDLILIGKQVQWMKFSAILGVVAALVGAIIGAYLAVKMPEFLKKQPQQKSESQLEQRTVSPPSVHQKIIIEKSLEDSASQQPPKKMINHLTTGSTRPCKATSG
ncbi:MAG: hypothetical protein RDU59_09990 [Thermodesulfobacteriota bacterium]|nr:hypothetical protein [Thermodesulfobacteriota bacterium]